MSSTAFAGVGDGALCTRDQPCNSRGIFTKKSAGPSKGDAVKINPAEVPVEKVTGIETIYYKGSFDFALVKGLGRIGAAISPSNSDETFFGPPAVENSSDFQQRMTDRSKFDAGKYALAGAVNLYSSEGSGFSHLNLNLGALARYEVATQHVKPGVGLQFIVGPMYAAGAAYQDEEQYNPGNSLPSMTLNTNVTSWSAGLSLDSVLLDYSVVQTSGDVESKASVATLTGFISRFILTAARRELMSPMPGFDFSTSSLIYNSDARVEWFGGVQVKTTSFLVLGVFYNYYLVHETSVGATVFF